jgi:anti-anti-sigma regulatory factor
MSNHLHLPAELTIYTAAELRSGWLVWLDSPLEDDGIVDGRDVAEVDTAGVQLLLSLSHAARRRERTLRIDRPSAALRAAFESLGLGALLAPAGAGAAD